MEGLFQAICRIGIFMICAQAVVHFRPQEAYEKYLKLLVSAMVLIQLFLPVSRILFHGDREGLAAKSQAFLEGLEEEMSAAENKAFETDALLEQMTLEEIRKRLEETSAMGEEGPSGIGGAESSGVGSTGTQVFGTESTGAGSSGTQISGTESTGAGSSGTQISGTESAGAEAPGAGNGGSDNIHIEQIEVEEIRVRPQTDHTEPSSAK